MNEIKLKFNQYHKLDFNTRLVFYSGIHIAYNKSTDNIPVQLIEINNVRLKVY